MDEDLLILNPDTDQAGIAKRNVRIIMIGDPVDVEQEILRGQLCNYCHVHDWSRPIKTPQGKEILTRNPHEVLRIWKKYVR